MSESIDRYTGHPKIKSPKKCYLFIIQEEPNQLEEENQKGKTRETENEFLPKILPFLGD